MKIEPENLKPGDWAVEFFSQRGQAAVFFILIPERGDPLFHFSVHRAEGGMKISMPHNSGRSMENGAWRQELKVSINTWLFENPVAGEDPFRAAIRRSLVENQMVSYLVPAAVKLVDEARAARFDTTEPFAHDKRFLVEYGDFGGHHLVLTTLAQAYETLVKRVQRAPCNIDKNLTKTVEQLTSGEA